MHCNVNMKQALGSQTAHLATASIHASRAREFAYRIEPALINAKDAAQMLGVSVRKFHSMRADLPAPVLLGPRAVRWKTAELRKFVDELVEAGARSEPPQLAAARDKEAKVELIGASAVECEARGSAIEHHCGVGRSPGQSNPKSPSEHLSA
jgi:predicted DNA-binding transcriptional regulator AlpA